MMVRENMDSCNESGYLSTSSSPPEVAAGTRYMSYSGSVPYYDQDGYEQYCINNAVPLYMDPHMQTEGSENIPPMQGHVDQTTSMDSGLASAEGWQSGMPVYSYAQHPHPYFGMPGYELIPNQPPIMLGPNGKPKRRRIPTPAQRRAANIRERRRMFNLNEAFDDLRTKVPTFAYEKRLSRIETLRLAITYIGFMSDLLEGKEPKDIKIGVDENVKWQLSPVSSEEAPETPVSSANSC